MWSRGAALAARRLAGKRLLGLSLRLGPLALLALAATPARAQQPTLYKVIVNSRNPVKELTSTEISDLLLRKTDRWSDGRAAAPLDLKGESSVRAVLTRDVHGRAISGVRTYWQREIFEGGKLPPQEVPDDASMVRLVAADVGSIGYVSRDTELVGAKEVRILWTPRRTRYVEPKYTEVARRARTRGRVVLGVTVDSEGRVVATDVVERLSFGLTEEAIAAVQQWQYAPTTVDGQPTRVTFDVVINFVQ